MAKSVQTSSSFPEFLGDSPIVSLLHRALTKDVEHRFPNARALLDALLSIDPATIPSLVARSEGVRVAPSISSSSSSASLSSVSTSPSPAPLSARRRTKRLAAIVVLCCITGISALSAYALLSPSSARREAEAEAPRPEEVESTRAHTSALPQRERGERPLHFDGAEVDEAPEQDSEASRRGREARLEDLPGAPLSRSVQRARAAPVAPVAPPKPSPHSKTSKVTKEAESLEDEDALDREMEWLLYGQ